MKANEVLELVRAGWTKADILAMAAGEAAAPVPAAEPAEPAAEPAAPADTAEPAAEPAAEPEKAPAWAVNLEASIAAMTRTIQTYNRTHSGKGAVETVQTTDDILREMFAEPKKGA